MSQKIKTSVEIDGSLTTGEYGVSTGHIKLDTTPTNTPTTPGSMYWNDIDGTVDIKLKGGNVSLQVGQENVKRIVNKSGIDLLEANYQVVRTRSVSEGGAAGQRLSVVLAQANNDANSAATIGVVTETILNNQEGFINISGEVHEINTTGSLQGETWVDGDLLYLSPTVAGKLTNIKPVAPQHLVAIAQVVYAHAIHGKIDVHIQNGYELDELHNVSAVTPNNNEVLTYETSSLLWKPKTISTILGYTPANDDNVVHLTGNETITGFKTFNTSSTYEDAVRFGGGINNRYLYVYNDSYGTGLANGPLFAGESIYFYNGGNSIDFSTNSVVRAIIDSNGLKSSAYYDFDNTSYYLNPAGSSNLFNVTANSFIKSGGTSSQFLKANGSVDSTSYYPASNPNGYISSYSETDTLATVTGRGATTSTLSTFDGGLNIGNAKLRWGGTTSPTLGFPFTGGPNGFWIDVNDGDTGGIVIDNDGTTIYGAGDSGHVFRVIDEDVYQSTSNVDSSTTFRIQQGQNGGGYIRGNFNITGYSISDESSRAPIFYDSNNTGYYVDPASTSNLNGLTVAGTISGNISGNADTVDGEHSNVFALHRGEGRNYIDYSRYVYNNGAYSGSGWVEPSDLGVRYASSSNNSNYLSILGGSGGNLNTMSYGRYYNYGSGSYWINGPSGMSYGSVYNLGGSSESVLSLQLASDINHNSTSSTRTMWFRTGNNLGFQNDWKEILHSGNYTSYANPTIYKGVNAYTNFQSFVSTPGTIRFDQCNSTGGFSNAPGGYTYGGVLSMRGDNFGFQLWGSHTGNFFFKTQWQDDQYSGWREVLHTSNYMDYAWVRSGAWKPSSLSSSTRLVGATSPDGGEFALAYSGGQIHAYTDGFFYQNEGAYRVMDANSIGDYTYGNFRKISDYSGDSTWFIRNNGRFVFANAHDWTQTLELYMPSGGSNNNTWAHFGQRASNNANGNFTGISVRRYINNASDLGDLQAGNMYSRIMYDDNDTAYYVNPNSTSNLIKIVAGGIGSSTLNTIGGNVGATSVSWNNAQLEIRCSDAGSVGIGFHRAGYTATGLWHTGNGLYTGDKFESGASLYSPIFYDSNNSGYYVDPASTSRMVTSNIDTMVSYYGMYNSQDVSVNSTYGVYWQNSASTDYGIYKAAGAWTQPLHINFYTGIRLRSHQSYGGTQFYNVSSGNTVMGVNNGNDVVSVYTQLHSPIMYDYNNTGYYLDPASSSYLNVLDCANRVNGAWLGISNTSSSTGNGLSLYNGNSGGQPTYGIMFAGTGTFGTFGSVTGDWATYFTMDSTANRGWIFRDVTNGNKASISNTGVATFAGDVVAYGSSDRELKDNITSIENALQKVKQIGGYTFDWNNKQDVYTGNDVGVIAQEIEEVLPQIVTTRDNGYKAVKYEKIVPLLIEAIKEQQTQIEELKQLVKQLTQK